MLVAINYLKIQWKCHTQKFFNENSFNFMILIIQENIFFSLSKT